MTSKQDADRSYSRRELLAGMQIIDWALSRMYLYGALSQRTTKRRPRTADLETHQATELIRLVKKWGHQAFRDQIVDLATAHAQGERLGQDAAGITDYRRSHDLVWTERFMGMCCDLSGERLSLKPDWQKAAIVVWTNIGDEIRAGIAPDFESPEQTAKRLDAPPED